MKLSIVIVNYNVKHYLWQCLLSVQRATEGIAAEVFVVDNASTDDSIAHLREHFPGVHYIENQENVGFSRANNQAIRQSQGEYVLLLNPDTIITSHTLRDCVQFLDANPRAGSVGVAMHGHDGRFALESRRGLPVPWTSLCKMLGLTSLFPKSRLFGRYYMQFLDASQVNAIEVVSGAFNMLRRQTLDEVGLLDEDFFMYGEDIDLSYRITQGGWRNYYLPTPILHYKGESTQKSSYKYVYTFYNAMLIFINKHFRQRYHFFTHVIRLAVHLRAALDMLLRFIRHCRPATPEIPNPTDFHIYEFSDAEGYDHILTDSIRRAQQGDHRPLGIHYPEEGITILPNGILTE